jgi:hypothetical protein
MKTTTQTAEYQRLHAKLSAFNTKLRNYNRDLALAMEQGDYEAGLIAISGTMAMETKLRLTQQRLRLETDRLCDTLHLDMNQLTITHHAHALRATGTTRPATAHTGSGAHNSNPAPNHSGARASKAIKKAATSQTGTISQSRLKCYISGPISGKPAAEYLANFEQGCHEARQLGMLPVNPCELPHASHNQTWEAFMKLDIEALLHCDAIFMLHDWQASRGACIEYALAKELGLKVIHQL